jgi:(p)ppGpp synthase/HD superfamily hydrolase
MPWSPEIWNAAWEFATLAHHGQCLPGSELPYAGHVAAVSMEVARAISIRHGGANQVAQPDLAIACALLHDTVEDTNTSLAAISERFGPEVARGVAALSKDPSVGDKPAQMLDSLARIRTCPTEVWMVKLADRIHNLRTPPHYWTSAKIETYRDEARQIHAALSEACPVLGARLLARIETYPG